MVSSRSDANRFPSMEMLNIWRPPPRLSKMREQFEFSFDSLPANMIKLLREMKGNAKNTKECIFYLFNKDRMYTYTGCFISYRYINYYIALWVCWISIAVWRGKECKSLLPQGEKCCIFFNYVKYTNLKSQN